MIHFNTSTQLLGRLSRIDHFNDINRLDTTQQAYNFLAMSPSITMIYARCWTR